MDEDVQDIAGAILQILKSRPSRFRQLLQKQCPKPRLPKMIIGGQRLINLPFQHHYKSRVSKSPYFSHFSLLGKWVSIHENSQLKDL